MDLITNLLGTPKLADMRTAADGAVKHMMKQCHKPPAMSTLYTLSQDATHEAVHLMCQMLVFDPVSILPIVIVILIIVIIDHLSRLNCGKQTRQRERQVPRRGALMQKQMLRSLRAICVAVLNP